MPSDLTIRTVSVDDADGLAAVAGFCADFVDWCYQRFPEDEHWMVTDYFKGLDWIEEMHRFAREDVPKGGLILLAEDEDRPVGCVMYWRFDEEICEMKRLYVSETAHGKGAGRALVNQLVHEARTAGFKKMYLETSIFQIEAQKLYESTGFSRRGPYHPGTPEMEALQIFYEQEL